MNTKLLMAASIAAAFALPISAGAAGDKAPSGKAAGDSAGAEKMFKSLDKNNDGFLSKEEAKGTPHDKDFATLDKNKDGKLSREEHAAAPEHAGDKSSAAGTGGTAGGSMSSGASGTGGAAAPKSGGGAPSKGY